MKFRWLLISLLGLPAVAQPHGPPAMATSFVQYMSGPAACQVAAVYFDQTQHKPYYCYPANTWVAFGGSSSGVTQLIAGANITLDPSGGTGAVTINATGGGSGPVQTCDASTVANYGQGVCIGAFTTAQILAFDGTSGTQTAIVSAPGAGKIIIPSLISTQYLSGALPFSGLCTWAVNLGNSGLSLNNLAVDCSQGSNQYAFATTQSLNTVAASAVDNVPLNLYLTGAVTGGPVNQIATSTIDSSGDDTSVPHATITAGNAGLLYSPGDNIWLACGGGNPMWQVATVDGVTGAVTSFTAVANGTGCITGSGQSTSTDGGGSGLELDVATVDAGWAVNDTFQETSCIEAATGHITSVAPTTKLITGFAIDMPGAGCTVGGGDVLEATSGNSFAGTNDTNGTISIDSVTSDAQSVLYAVYFSVFPIT